MLLFAFEIEISPAGPCGGSGVSSHSSVVKQVFTCCTLATTIRWLTSPPQSSHTLPGGESLWKCLTNRVYVLGLLPDLLLLQVTARENTLPGRHRAPRVKDTWPHLVFEVRLTRTFLLKYLHLIVLTVLSITSLSVPEVNFILFLKLKSFSILRL